MAELSCLEAEWPELLARLPGGFDLDATARASGAFRRPRGVGDAASLLRLALAYGGLGLSLRGVSAWAGAAGVAQVSDVALLQRLRGADAWLGQVVQALLAERLPAPVMPALPSALGTRARRCLLVDATCLCAPGADRTSWRLHVGYDLQAGRAVQVSLTDGHGGESLRRFACGPGDLLVADRGYARPGDLRPPIAAGADLLVRVGWNSLRLLGADGAALDLFSALAGLPGGEADGEVPVLVDERRPGPDGQPGRLALRLVMHQKTPEQAQRPQDDLRRTAQKRGRAPDPRSLEAARWVLLLTSLPQATHAPGAVAALYRLRWQVELSFKRWKSLAGLDALPAHDPRLARAWIHARLILTVLAEDLAGPGPALSPCAPGSAPSPAAALPARHARRPGRQAAGTRAASTARMHRAVLAHDDAEPGRPPRRRPRRRPVAHGPARAGNLDPPPHRTTATTATPNAPSIPAVLAHMRAGVRGSWLRSGARWC